MHRYQYPIALACCFLIYMHFQFLILKKSTFKKAQETHTHTHTQFARVELLSFATKSVLVCLVLKDLIEFFGLSFMIDDDCELASFFYKIYK